jgi:sugar-phosphatase
LGITDPEEVAVLTRAKQERYRGAVGRGEVRLFPGVHEALAALRGEGRRLFVVTGASRLSAQSVLRANRIDALFEGVTAAEDAHSGKPSAAPYSHTLELHNLAVADCLAIEDAAAGVASARAAGIDVVLVNTECVVPGVPSLGPIGMLASLILS